MWKLTSSESELSRRCHGVALIKNYELDPLAHQLLSAAETLDLLTHHVDATVIGGIQLEDHVLIFVRSIEVLCNGNDARSLTRARRTVEKQVRHLSSVNKLLDYKP